MENYLLITVEKLKEVADKNNANFARYNVPNERFELSNDNFNWTYDWYIEGDTELEEILKKQPI